MKHSVSNRKELTILKLEEEVFDVRFASTFRETIDSLVSKDNSRNLIVDFSQVKAIDSSGISSILLAHQLANQSEGLAIFVSLCQQIKDLLKLANLDKQLYIFSSINEVMTLIEPALKGKRGHKPRQQPIRYEPVDELVDELEILPDEVFDPTEFSDPLDEHVVEESDLKPELPIESAPKKRGRPKKSCDNGSDEPDPVD
jgi:anti-anti-sigma factor